MLSTSERNTFHAAGHVEEYFIVVNAVGSEYVSYVSDVFNSIDRAESIYCDVVYADFLELDCNYDYCVTLYMRLGNVIEEIEYVTL